MAQVQVNPNEDTEFHDALRARGIIPPKAPSRSPSPELPTDQEIRASQLANATIADIDRALEEDGLDQAGEEEERILQRLRRERMAALARETKSHRFGRVYPIQRPDYTREVTEASKANPYGNDGDVEDDEHDEDDRAPVTGASSLGERNELKSQKHKGTGVVCFLYKDSMDTCRLVAKYLDTLAAKYPATKFVSIVGDKCIPNYPDKNLPTLLIYRNGELHRQIIGLRPEIGLDGMNTKCEDIELLLTAVGVLDRSQVPGASTYDDGRGGERDGGRGEDDGEDSDEGFGGTRRGEGAKSKNARVKTQEEEDAELDWDL
ncbi:thioredoxin-like protein [Violaceomyces palustris]|uniref:Thioredoxin-like protein n=1 Tax=Violaceomyces palustris TaxID=1673888 RepID=A0ACD0P242_9BASI|nr:thioredoxin-like protein [Violaceomyces palustris]